MLMHTIPSMGPFGTNCYLVWDDNMDGVLIDAPCDPGQIMAVIYEKGVYLKKILLTHGHCDHIAAAAQIMRTTGADCVIHENDLKKLTNDDSNLTRYFNLPPTEPVTNAQTVQDGDVITAGTLEFEVLHTPGHTSGSVCYICGDVMFTGDTLFKGSMGRTDMYDGNEEDIFSSLAVLYAFDTATPYKIYPGHGEPSTLDDERRSNQYMLYAAKNYSI